MANTNEHWIIIYNHCLHRKLSTLERLFSLGLKSSVKTTSRGLTTWCSPHMKAITVYFNTWIFCFAEDSKIISGIENTLTESYWKKNWFSTHFRFSKVVDRATTCCSPRDNLFISLYIIYLWVVHRVVSLVSKFSVKHPNCLITL